MRNRLLAALASIMIAGSVLTLATDDAFALRGGVGYRGGARVAGGYRGAYRAGAYYRRGCGYDAFGRWVCPYGY